MTAQLGSDEEHEIGTPLPRLLREVSGLQPERDEEHVGLDLAGVVSMQRLRIGDVGGGVTAAVWPAELKTQALHLYFDGRAERLVREARTVGWQVMATPHLAYHTSPPARRVYFDLYPDVDEYISRWAGPDLGMIGGHPAGEVRNSLWPWLVRRGYTTAEEALVLDEFLPLVGSRSVHLRPGLRLHRRWPAHEVRELARRGELALTVRAAVNSLLAVADEPLLPLAVV